SFRFPKRCPSVLGSVNFHLALTMNQSDQDHQILQPILQHFFATICRQCPDTWTKASVELSFRFPQARIRVLAEKKTHGDKECYRETHHLTRPKISDRAN